MSVYLPDPYPDELLYSIVARHLAWHGENRWRGSLVAAFASHAPPAVDVPGDLSCLERHAGAAFAFEPVVEEMTLLPYYMAFVDEDRKQAVLDAMRVGNKKAARQGIGLTGRIRSGVPMHFRYCPRCRAEDIESYGETFWRRSHQLRGALMCLDHAVPLHESAQRFAVRKTHALADATSSTSATGSPFYLPSDHERTLALAVSRRCRDFLRRDFGEWTSDRKDIVKHYRNAAVARGFRLKMASVDVPRLTAAFAATYGPTLLAHYGLEPREGERTWLVHYFRGREAPTRPLEHALVQVFLESLCEGEPEDSHLGRAPWVCPSPFEDPEKRPTVNPRFVIRSGRRYAYARCNCGLRFSWLKVDETDPHLPVVLRYLSLPQPWIDHIGTLDAGGISKSVIAKTMGMQVHLVRRCLAGDAPKALEESEIADRREAWERVLGRVDRRSRALAREADKSLYQWLYVNDRAWLLADRRNYRERMVNTGQNWERLDEEYLLALRVVVARLRGDMMAARLSPTMMLRTAGLPFGPFRNSPERLPRSMAAIREATETKQQAFIRRAHLAAKHLFDEGETLTVTKLRRMSRMSTSFSKSGLPSDFFSSLVDHYDLAPS